MSRLSGSTLQHARRDKRDTQQKRECGAHSLTANSSPIVCYKRFVYCFRSCIMLKSLLFCYRWKKVIDAVQSEGNLNHIGSLRRKMTIIIGNGHVGIWAQHARLCRACRDGRSGIWAYMFELKVCSKWLRCFIMVAFHHLSFFGIYHWIVFHSVKCLLNRLYKLCFAYSWLSRCFLLTGCTIY